MDHPWSTMSIGEKKTKSVIRDLHKLRFAPMCLFMWSHPRYELRAAIWVFWSDAPLVKLCQQLISNSAEYYGGPVRDACSNNPLFPKRLSLPPLIARWLLTHYSELPPPLVGAASVNTAECWTSFFQLPVVESFHTKQPRESSDFWPLPFEAAWAKVDLVTFSVLPSNPEGTAPQLEVSLRSAPERRRGKSKVKRSGGGFSKGVSAVSVQPLVHCQTRPSGRMSQSRVVTFARNHPLAPGSHFCGWCKPEPRDGETGGEENLIAGRDKRDERRCRK